MKVVLFGCWVVLAMIPRPTNTYTINFTRTDWDGVQSPKCGPNIDLMDVSTVNTINQIRLSFTENPTEMRIMWVTNKVDERNLVQYGPLRTDLNYTSFSFYDQHKFADDTYTSGFIHNALLVNLIPGRIHYYQIISNGQTSEVYKFIAAPDTYSDAPVNIFHTGDVGAFGTSVMVTKNMIDRMEEEDFHATFVCGDLSYANKHSGKKPENNWAKQEIWDTYGAMIEPVARHMGYMAAPGNHEIDVPDSTNENMTSYMRRFALPGNGRYYGFPLGMVYFVAVSTDESIDEKSTQGRWLDNRLTWVNERRGKYPWLVIFQHRPIYNSNLNHGNWTGVNGWDTDFDYPDKNGWPKAYEKLLLKHDVDLILNGHVHHYELTYPTKENKTTTNYDDDKDFRAPIHITCGHGGQKLYRYTWDTEDADDKENTYTDHVPEFVSFRDNAHWGHCELSFIDRDTVQHRMFRMGESNAANVVNITRRHGNGASLGQGWSWGVWVGLVVLLVR